VIGNDYSARVLAVYTTLAYTPDRPSRSDRALARELERRAVPLKLVQEAMLLATVRRHFRDPSLPPLDRIRSLHYFLPVIQQLQAEPLDPFYVDYLKRKLDAIPQPDPRTDGEPPK
jgi:hypothetical protein